MEQDDVQLLDHIAKGDEAAFSAFYRRHENRVYRFILSKLNDSAEAADILNETFLEIWRKAGTFEGKSKPTTWLFGIAYHKTMDRFRKKKTLSTDAETFPEIADESPDAMACLMGAEAAEHIRFCLEKLKEPQRTVLELAFYEDMGYAEIARIADCPENTVKTRVFHAKQAMRHCLDSRMGDAA